MSEKLKFLSVTIFATDEYVARLERAGVHAVNMDRSPMEIYLPVDAISCLTRVEPGNNRSPFKVHIKKSYLLDAPFPVKNTGTIHLTPEQVEMIK